MIIAEQMGASGVPGVVEVLLHICGTRNEMIRQEAFATLARFSGVGL